MRVEHRAIEKGQSSWYYQVQTGQRKKVHRVEETVEGELVSPDERGCLFCASGWNVPCGM